MILSNLLSGVELRSGLNSILLLINGQNRIPTINILQWERSKQSMNKPACLSSGGFYFLVAGIEGAVRS
jgi:hypothetical protein